MKKITAIITACLITAIFAFSGCQKQEGQKPEGTQPPPSSAPTTTTAPTGTATR